MAANRAIRRRRETVPEDCSNLERILAEIPNSRAIVVSHLRQSLLTSETYKDFVADLDADPKADLGSLCLKHGVEPSQVLADTQRAAYAIADEALLLSKAISTKIVAARLPKVVERGMIEGGKADGLADRHYILQNEGFHMAPKAAQINVNQNNQHGVGLPSFEEDTKGLSDILSSDDRLLTEGDTDWIEAEVEEAELVPIGAKESSE